MTLAAKLLPLLAAISFLPACRNVARPPAATAPIAADIGPLTPSPRLIVGRIVAVDPSRSMAFVELAADVSASALAEGTELATRRQDFTPTSRLQASRYVRGRTLGTRIVSGQPALDDEVVWLAP